MKRTESMFEVEAYLPHLDSEGRRYYAWVGKRVDNLPSHVLRVRCKHCKSEAIRLHRGSKVKWHAEHQIKEDSSECPGGICDKEGSLRAKDI